ncbi:hypothetical protein MKX03_034620 [Papaver bracteatum]|nr:hypothetical protein MKX03_034620 [Papaver bracteatum]
MEQQENGTCSLTIAYMPLPGSELWTDGLICAYEYTGNHLTGCMDKHTAGGSHNWVPIGWDRISELTQRVQADGGCTEFADAAWPTWWCHWLDSDVRNKLLRDEADASVDLVRFEGGERIKSYVLGTKHSVGNPFVYEDDSPIVLRSFTEKNFLISVLHGKEIVSGISVRDVTELLAAGGTNAPRMIHGVIAQLRRNHEDMNLLGATLNKEILELSIQLTAVIRSLRAREKVVSELLCHLRGNAARNLLEGVKKNTRESIKEQEAVFRQLRRIQDVIESCVRSWSKIKSLRVAHNFRVFGVCCLVLLVITILFAFNVDGIPGAKDTPYAFALFCGLLVLLGVVLFTVGIRLNKPITERIAE